MLSKLKKLFSSKPPAKAAEAPFGASLHWIAADKNPWGVRILDCRPVSTGWRSTTADPSIAKSFLQLRHADGRAHLQAEPLPVQVSGEFTLPVPELPPQGCFSSARQMEEKWDLFHFDNRLFISRSWTGMLSYTASLHCDGNSLHVSDIRATPLYENEHLLRELHFILRAYGNRVIMPHPLPVNLAPDDSIASKEQIALHTFNSYGSFGWFGTFEDTIPLREIARSDLAEWIKRQAKNSND